MRDEIDQTFLVFDKEEQCSSSKDVSTFQVVSVILTFSTSVLTAHKVEKDVTVFIFFLTAQ